MKLLLAATLVFSLAAVGSVGCGKQTDTATPKGDKEKKKAEQDKGDKDKGDKDKSLKVKADPDKVEIVQGKRQKVKITITAGQGAGKLQISADAPKDSKLKAEVSKKELDKSGDVELTITAEADAKPGANEVAVIVSPAQGDEEVVATIRVTVKKKE